VKLSELGFLQRSSGRHAESFEDAGEIVGAPAVTQYERNRHRLRILADLQSAWRLPEQLLEAVIHVQLLEQNLRQGWRPA
jgi:HD-like signal output (HDOD) protein